VRVDTDSSDKVITYTGSFGYMCASFPPQFRVSKHYQDLAEDSRPTAWAKGCSGIVTISRIFRVGYFTWPYDHSLSVISVSSVLVGYISPLNTCRYPIRPCCHSSLRSSRASRELYFSRSPSLSDRCSRDVGTFDYTFCHRCLQNSTSMQFLWRNFDCEAAVYFWCSPWRFI
jgi:hypothetical protein